MMLRRTVTVPRTGKKKERSVGGSNCSHLKQGEMKSEFHDIGKLIDWVAVGLHAPKTKVEPHEFERLIEPWAEQWSGPITREPRWLS